MDLSTVEDLKELKSLAYDTLQALEMQQNNLRLIQARLAELEQRPAPAPAPAPKK